MKPTSQWSIRKRRCPEGRGKTDILLEWKMEKGRKVLHSISCDNPHLADYSGMDCRWGCLEMEKISGKKKS